MTHCLRGLGLAATLVFVSSLTVVPQADAQSTAAYLYVQVGGPSGAVYGYSANSSGQLTAISGSPFKPGTAIVGGNGTQFFTLGETLLHSFSVGSNGAIGSQVSQVPVYDYSGSDCGYSSYPDDSAVLDHTGKYMYVLLQGGTSGTCEAYQTYAISSSGDFTFLGDTETNIQNEEPVTGGTYLPSILGNETFAYAGDYSGHLMGLVGFQRASSGELQSMQFTETDPPLNNNYWGTSSPDASPTGNYVALLLYPGDSGPPYLASYTVDSKGNLSTTNTTSNMPVVKGDSTIFSPSGALLANWGGLNDGLELYHFNGAAPIAPYQQLLKGTTIQQVAWDSSNHLYAISNSSNMIYVFTVTPTSVTQVSSYSIKAPVSVVVVNKAQTSGGCAAPSGNGVNVCSPAEGATVGSPVQISAAATVSGGVYRFEVWNGTTKLLSSDNGTIDQSLSLAPGSYKLTFDAYNSSKSTHEYAYRDVTVN